ncbi:unnamed protein product [Malus baccata var. baccata]
MRNIYTSSLHASFTALAVSRREISTYESGLSSCEAKRPQVLHVTQLLSTCRLENPPHMQGRVESCPISVRDKVCYVLI